MEAENAILGTTTPNAEDGNTSQGSGNATLGTGNATQRETPQKSTHVFAATTTYSPVVVNRGNID